jgi:hypothetical protein
MLDYLGCAVSAATTLESALPSVLMYELSRSQ